MAFNKAIKSGKEHRNPIQKQKQLIKPAVIMGAVNIVRGIDYMLLAKHKKKQVNQ